MAGNTTAISGSVCRVSIDGTNNLTYTDGWTMTITVENHDVTSQGDTYRGRIQGLIDWGGTISGHTILSTTAYQYIDIYNVLQGASPDATPTADSKFFLEDSGDYYDGPIILSGLTINARIGDRVNWTCNFQGTGQLDLTVAA